MLLTRAPLYSAPEGAFLVRLACVRRAASVDSEPGSNSRLIFYSSGLVPLTPFTEASLPSQALLADHLNVLPVPIAVMIDPAFSRFLPRPVRIASSGPIAARGRSSFLNFST